MILLRTTACHLFPTHQGTYIDNIPFAHSAANIMTQRKLGGAEVSQPQHYLLGIPRHVLKSQWARLLGQRGPAGLKQEGLYTRHGCLVRSILYDGCFAGLCGRRLMGLVRANPATSAPSHICETWRNVAQTCLIIKEMGPERSRINVSDPI